MVTWLSHDSLSLFFDSLIMMCLVVVLFDFILFVVFAELLSF